MSSSNPRPTSTQATPSSARPVICVFCGSNPGSSPVHLAAARQLAETFHKHSISLVYGGGTVGLMGEVARSLVKLSGPEAVRGVIPRALMEFEQAGRGSGHGKNGIDEAIYGSTTIVEDMHSRKRTMARMVMDGGPGSGFAALSGGYGTLEELMEMVTWNQLGIHRLGIVLFNVDGYYDGLVQWVKQAVSSGFVAAGSAGILVEATSADEVVTSLQHYQVAEGRYRLDWNQN